MSTHPLFCRGMDNLDPEDLVPTFLTNSIIILIRITSTGIQTSQHPCIYAHAILYRRCVAHGNLQDPLFFLGQAHSFLYYLLCKQKWLAKALSLLHSSKLGDSSSTPKPHCSCAAGRSIEITTFSVATEGCSIAVAIIIVISQSVVATIVEPTYASLSAAVFFAVGG